MDKIASPDELQAELRKLLAYAESEVPSRSKLATGLKQLADRVARKGDYPTRRGARIRVLAREWLYSPEAHSHGVGTLLHGAVGKVKRIADSPGGYSYIIEFPANERNLKDYDPSRFPFDTISARASNHHFEQGILFF